MMALDTIVSLLSSMQEYLDRTIGLLDLKAQQDMAFWAMLMTLTSIGSFLASVVSLIALFRTIEFSRQANKNAIEGLNLATEEAKDAREARARDLKMAASQQRPWVMLNLEPRLGAEFHDFHIRQEVVFHLKNYGASPAFNLALHQSIDQPITGVDHYEKLWEFCDSFLNEYEEEKGGFDIPPAEAAQEDRQIDAKPPNAEFLDGDADAAIYCLVAYSNFDRSRIFVSGKAYFLRWRPEVYSSAQIMVMASLATERDL